LCFFLLLLPLLLLLLLLPLLLLLLTVAGFRVIAMSVLPVDHDSIRYGSCDAGCSIHATDKTLNLLMEKAAKILNLKPHLCRIASRQDSQSSKVR
jgi:hypothetical protein